MSELKVKKNAAFALDYFKDSSEQNAEISLALPQPNSVLDFLYKMNKTNSTNLYPPMKGYLRETCKSQNINPIYLNLSSPSVSFRS